MPSRSTHLRPIESKYLVGLMLAAKGSSTNARRVRSGSCESEKDMGTPYRQVCLRLRRVFIITGIDVWLSGIGSRQRFEFDFHRSMRLSGKAGLTAEDQRMQLTNAILDEKPRWSQKTVRPENTGKKDEDKKQSRPKNRSSADSYTDTDAKSNSMTAACDRAVALPGQAWPSRIPPDQSDHVATLGHDDFKDKSDQQIKSKRREQEQASTTSENLHSSEERTRSFVGDT